MEGDFVEQCSQILVKYGFILYPLGDKELKKKGASFSEPPIIFVSHQVTISLFNFPHHLLNILSAVYWYQPQHYDH